MISEIINVLRSNEFFGAGEFTEIAKGKHEIVSNCKQFKNKAKRLWLSLKK
jgi:hypothetical protein